MCNTVAGPLTPPPHIHSGDGTVTFGAVVARAKLLLASVDLKCCILLVEVDVASLTLH